jgi:CPA2 family monovalent cation:H+ antiporter-2
MNPETVRTEKAAGQPIFYGDGSQPAVLEEIGVKTARVIAIAVSDPQATRSITKTARTLNSSLHILTRTRYLQEVQPLYDLGASEVIPEEFEASVEIFSRVLRKYLIPREDINFFIDQVRSDNYEIFRTPSPLPPSIGDVQGHLPNVEIASVRITDRSGVTDKTLADIDLRKSYGVTLLAVQRGPEVLSNPAGDTRLKPGDLAILMGKPEQISRVTGLFQKPG